MSLSFGRDLLAIPGPSVIPDRVLNAMHRASPNIYEGELIDLTEKILDDLKTLAGTRHHAAIYIANGHGTWEAALANIFAPGEHALVLNTGRFALGWAGMAEKMGITCTVLDFGQQASLDFEQIRETLTADKTHKFKAVLVVHTDTSSSVRNDIAALRQAITATGHPALLAVDCIASFGCDPFDMDQLGVDVMVAACQKGLMTPPGMGFLFWNERAQINAETTTKPSAYWDWTPRIRGNDYWQRFDGTAPTHHLFGLGEALKMIAEEGPANTFKRHATHARAIWAAVNAWGQGGPMQLNIADPTIRSHSVTTILIPGHDASNMRRWLQSQTGLTLGLGLGFETRADLMNGDSAFRIGHMGHVNPVMVLGTLASIESALIACHIPHGTGAIEAVAKVIALSEGAHSAHRQRPNRPQTV